MAKAPTKEKIENQFDERRETLVVETKTSFESGPADSDAREKVRRLIHANPKDAKKLEYVRCPTGLIRHVTVTAEDFERLGVK